jgi:putative FmdB family regulatory protein
MPGFVHEARGSCSEEEPVPTYEYACTACEERLEVVQSFTDEALTQCPACGGRLRKVFSAAGIIFKGSGFYRTDSRSTAKSSSNGAGNKGESEGAESKTADAKGKESKSSDSSSSAGSSGSSSSSGSAGDKSGSSSSGSGSGSGSGSAEKVA